jgi:hypothetical protein
MGTYVGFDPGGLGSFGWAVVTGETLPLNFVDCGIADHAQGAFNAVISCLDSSKLKIKAIGIDAPCSGSEMVTGAWTKWCGGPLCVLVQMAQPLAPLMAFEGHA